jgi:nicotinate-nucleotide adenylyltransferase
MAPGMAVGLLGGSFDPPHAGHLMLSRAALRCFGLDRVVWLASPGNPLKPDAPAALARRLQAARALIDHPRIAVSDFEARNGTRYTAETLAALRRRHPAVRFVWLMGADNLVQIHLWGQWRQIFDTTPVGVLARPGSRLAARNAVAARVYRAARLPVAQSRALPAAGAPAWCFANMPMSGLSSSALRQAGQWQRDGQSLAEM